MLLLFSDQHLGTRGDTLFYDGGITDAANSETPREHAHADNVKGTDVNSRYLIGYLLRFCSCLL